VAEGPAGVLTASAEYEQFCRARLADPYPILERLRENEPVHWSPRLRSWVITGYDLVVGALRSGTLSNDRTSINMRAVPADSRELYRGLEVHVSNWLGFTDPPKHQRMRRVARQILSVEGAQRLAPLVREMSLERLTGLRGRAEVEVVGELALDLPLRVICRSLGVPEGEAARFHRWSTQIAGFAGIVHPDPVGQAGLVDAANEGWLEAEEYFGWLLERRQSQPLEDGVSVLAAALAAGQLSRDEAIGLCVFILAAGHGTTAALVGNLIFLLLSHRPQLEAVCADSGLIGAAVEETLRYESPIPMMSRLAGRELELAGARIGAGDAVVLQLAAANRDPGRFEDPASFAVARGDSRHLAFGYGPHFCLGAPLARAQAGAILQALVETGTLSRWALATSPCWRAGSHDSRDLTELRVRVAG